MRLLRPSGYRVMPWRNGGGTTTELYVHGPSPEGFDWRVSIADVGADGPFSRFDGYDRHIMAIDGNGFVLEGGPDGDIDASRLCDPRSFCGDWAISCRLLDGPTRDFNLMARREKFLSALVVTSGSEDRILHSGNGCIFAHVIRGSIAAGSMMLAESDSLLVEPRESIALCSRQASTVVAICSILPRT